MKFLKEKFYDKNNNIDFFLTDNNRLLKLEEQGVIPEKIKKEFAENFTKNLIESEVVPEIRQIVENVRKNYPKNSWSIDFPSWTGVFNEQQGKGVMIIGAEPHIYYEHLQTVYHFHSEISIDDYLQKVHIFRLLSEILSSRFNKSKEEVLEMCYLTDLFPLSPFRGNGTSVGSVDKLQAVIGEGDWVQMRYEYAKKSLPLEIEGVKPKLIITQGKEVFKELVRILDIKEAVKEHFVEPKSGRRQYIRKTHWRGIEVISVPHIGSKRMKTFWDNNLEKIKKVFSEI